MTIIVIIMWWYCCLRQPVFGHASLLVFAHTPSASNFPHRVCCHWLSAMPAQHMKAPEQAREDTSPAKIDVTSKSPVRDISVVTLIRTDTTLDHSQKAEKVWVYMAAPAMCTCMHWLPTFWVHRHLLNPLTYKLLFTVKKQHSLC